MRNNRRVTQLEIARRAGVSQTMVSFVLNNRFMDRVPDETRNKILKVAKEIGYRANYFARSLVLGKTNSIGLIYEDTFEFLTNDPFLSSIFMGANREIGKRRQNLVFSTISSQQEFFPPMMDSYLVEGILLLGSKNPRLSSELRKRGIPHVLIDPFYRENKSPCLLIDNKKCALLVTDYLAGCGHRRIGMVVPCMSSGDVAWSFQERMEGFRLGLSKNKLPFDREQVVLLEYGFSNSSEFPDFQPGFIGGKKLLQSKNRPTAIFAANDRVALGILKAAAELGLNVPNDVSIVGFDDLDFAKTTQPPLSTVSIDKELLGTRSVELLLEIVQGRKVKEERFPGQLTIRSSTKL